MWSFTRKEAKEPPLMMLSPNDPFTLHQAYEGVFAVGATGSGKSSTLARLMLGLMKRGAGMLVLTANIEDYAQVAKLAKLAGREADLRRFAPDEPWRFDFLQYELSSPGGSVATAAQMMNDLVDFSTKTQSQNSTEPFWVLASARQIRMGLTVVNAALGTCSLPDIYHFISTMPTTPAEKDTPEFRESFCGQCLLGAMQNLTPDVELAGDYVLKEWVRLGDRTARSIQANTMNVLEKFMHGTVRELVASGMTNSSPQDALDGRILAIDLPVLRYRESGQFVQMAWKLAVQRAAMRRDVADRDVVIWADEAQLHALPGVDSMVQAVARKHKLIQVAITQNLPLLYSVLKNKDDALAWVSNLQTWFMFSNADKETGELCSARCGQSKHLLASMSAGGKPHGNWRRTGSDISSATPSAPSPSNRGG